MSRCKHCGNEVNFEIDRGEEICPQCGWSQTANSSNLRRRFHEAPVVKLILTLIAVVLVLISGQLILYVVRPLFLGHSPPTVPTSTTTMVQQLRGPSSSTTEAVSPEILAFLQPDWESSEQEIVALLDQDPPLNESVPINGIPTTVIAYNHSELGHQGGVAFSFDQDRLFSITWTFGEDRQSTIEQYLLSEYGSPETLHGLPTWYDDDTVIMMVTSPVMSALYFNYIPIKDERWQRRSALGIVPR